MFDLLSLTVFGREWKLIVSGLEVSMQRQEVGQEGQEEEEAREQVESDTYARGGRGARGGGGRF